jgi:hypothetical protein
MKNSYPFWTYLSPIKMIQGNVEHTVKVTHLGGGVYGCRVFLNGVLNAENRCKGKANIGSACRDLLRWESKLGNWSKYADSSRSRHGRKQNKKLWKKDQEENA